MGRAMSADYDSPENENGLISDKTRNAAQNAQNGTRSRRWRRYGLPLVTLSGVATLTLTGTACIASSNPSSAPGVTAAGTYTCSATGSTATRAIPVTGASPDGTTDDTAAIQNAINTAGHDGGGVVSLPAGTYLVNQGLRLKNNVKLVGAGPATILKAGPGFLASQDPDGGYPLINTAGAANTTIADLTANQSGDTLNGNLPGRLAGYVVEGRGSHNTVVDGVYVRDPFTYSIAMVDSTDFCVQKSNVLVTTSGKYDQLDGIHILDSNTGQVINNTITSGDDGLAAHTIGASTHDVVFANNVVHGGANDDGLQIAVGNYPVYNLKIENNEFTTSAYGIRTGYYDNRTGAVQGIQISANYIHNLQAPDSPAVAIGGFGGRGTITNVSVTGNRTCGTGGITVSPGPGNSAARNTGC
jgi:polygalacturonase